MLGRPQRFERRQRVAAAKAIDHREALAFLHSSRRRHWQLLQRCNTWKGPYPSGACHSLPLDFASKSFVIMLAPASRAELRYFTRGSKHSSGGSIQVREIYLRSDVPRGTAACYAPLEQQISEETKETTHNAWKPLQQPQQPQQPQPLTIPRRAIECCQPRRGPTSSLMPSP